MFLTVVGLIGLIIFFVFAILWLVGTPARRPLFWQIAVVGLLFWALTAIIAGLITVL